MSVLLTRADVVSVMDTVRPAIWAFLARFAKRQDLAIIVLDPACHDREEPLYVEYIGDTSKWKHRYDDIALGKASVCWRTKCNSGEVREKAPFLFIAGDPPYQGGVYEDGLVVACSGVEAYFDEMFAKWIAEGLRAISRHRRKTEVDDKDLDAIPEYDDK